MEVEEGKTGCDRDRKIFSNGAEEDTNSTVKGEGTKISITSIGKRGHVS